MLSYIACSKSWEFPAYKAPHRDFLHFRRLNADGGRLWANTHVGRHWLGWRQPPWCDNPSSSCLWGTDTMTYMHVACQLLHSKSASTILYIYNVANPLFGLVHPRDAGLDGKASFLHADESALLQVAGL